jgi:hypothetical protein
MQFKTSISALARPRHRSYDAKNLAATKALRSRAESFCPFGAMASRPPYFNRIALYAFIVSVIAFSTGSRSMLDAP